MQIPPNSAPTRGAPLVLALVAAAGFGLAGCGDDSSTTTPAPAPAPPAAPAAPDPVAVPGGLKVTAGGHDFLEFGWDAVEGASGYEIQLSLKEGDFSSVSTATVATTMHRFTVKPETTGYARVRAHDGERQSDWSETAMGASAAAPVPPLVLTAPSPEVSGRGPDFIEWSWEPVAEALSYEVRVAATEAGLDAASPEIVTETMVRVETEPETERFVRVRAVAGTEESPIVSEWSDAVSGRSAAAPIAFVVSLTPPEAGADRECGGQAFCPDRGTDAKKAMASVNPRMMVTASRDTRITPLFVAGAPAVIASAGGDTPFLHSSGIEALQTTIAGDGVTFELRPLSGGAGQQPTAAATEAALYITCGPFRCSEAAAEAPAAPEITIADTDTCDGFRVDLEVRKGLAQNGSQRYRQNGLEMGFVYTSNRPAKVTHEIELGAGKTMTVPGTDLEATSTRLWLDMRPAPEANAGDRRNKFGGPLNRDDFAPSFQGETSNAEAYWSSGPFYRGRSMQDPGPIQNGPWDCAVTSDITTDSGRGPQSWSYYTAARSFGAAMSDPVQRPYNCFLLLTDGLYVSEGHAPVGRPIEVEWNDYLPGYRVQVVPEGGVAWAGSRVSDWGKDHPFETLTCEPVTFPVADQVDLCEDFRKEVDDWWGAGLEGSDPPFRVEYEAASRATHEIDDRLTFSVAGGSGFRPWNGKLLYIVIRPNRNVNQNFSGNYVRRPEGARHANLWLVDDRWPGDGINGTIRDRNLYWQQPGSGARADGDPTEYHNLEGGWRTSPQWRKVMWVQIEDSDGDPQHGDFGKIDMVKEGSCVYSGCSPNSADGRAAYVPDGNPDNYNGNEDADRCTDDDGGAGCDAKLDFDLSATFRRIRDLDTCEHTIEAPITCTWHADGDGRQARTGTRGREAGRRNWHDFDRNGRIQNDFVECVPR